MKNCLISQVFCYVAQKMKAEGSEKTWDQCRIKLKNLKSQYRYVKDRIPNIDEVDLEDDEVLKQLIAECQGRGISPSNIKHLKNVKRFIVKSSDAAQLKTPPMDVTAGIQTSNLLSNEVVVFGEQSSSRISSRLDQKSSLIESDCRNYLSDDECSSQSPEETTITIDGIFFSNIFFFCVISTTYFASLDIFQSPFLKSKRKNQLTPTPNF